MFALVPSSASVIRGLKALSDCRLHNHGRRFQVRPTPFARGQRGWLRGTRRYLALTAGLTASFAVTSAVAPASAGQPLLARGRSDAESIAVLSGVYDRTGGPGTPFWWDHTDLTVTVAAAPGADPVLTQAVRDAIATWRMVLASEIPILSFTDVTGDARRSRGADIVVHYVPKAGGFVWGGNAICGFQKCQNVILRSDLIGLDQSRNGEPDFDATRVYREAVHELGHALGLGHASPLETSRDIMGYGWALPDPDLTPILSDCDLDGIRAAFAWALRGEEPHPATVASVTCR